MNGNQTIIKKPYSSEEPKAFAYDYSYWSHDGFKLEPNGYFSPQNSKYADQVCHKFYSLKKNNMK